jgi:hypothetical protein
MARVYRMLCAALFGALLFFSTVAAQAVFPAEVAALPHGHPRKMLAADLVGIMLARLDAVTLFTTAVALVLALRLGRRRAALLPLCAGLCALASVLAFTPAIHAMRDAGQTALPKFGLLHAASAGLLLAEMILLAAAAWIG